MQALYLKKSLHLIAVLVFILAGCAGPLVVKYEPKTKGQFISPKPVAIHVGQFEDKRAPAKTTHEDPRTIGSVQSTVADMTGDKLMLSEDVTDIVERAYEKELALAGLVVVPEKEKAEYVVSGEVREFRLYIGKRDEIGIEVASTLKNAQTNSVVWAGVESERGDRFAGVMGNSRATISNYIAATLQKVVRKSIASAGTRLSPGAASEKQLEGSAAPAAAGEGKIVITASPERSKVYFDGIYYGLTPITIEMPPGVYEVTIKQSGFKLFNEKVSIRRDATTEMEAELEKE